MPVSKMLYLETSFSKTETFPQSNNNAYLFHLDTRVNQHISDVQRARSTCTNKLSRWTAPGAEILN